MSNEAPARDGYKGVLDFWFVQSQPSQWWQKDQAFDRLISDTFGLLHSQAVAGELWTWRENPQGALAEILILDQFSRNIFRNLPQAFAADSQALVLSQIAVAQGFDQQLPKLERSFLYMPYMHSESLIIHQQAVKLFEQLDNQQSLDFEIQHKKIIERFGRYPHRNRILGRVSNQEEVNFLKQANSSF